MATDVRHYADSSHDDYLLLWQYRQSSRFLAMVTAFLDVIQSGRMDPWRLLELLEIDVRMADYRDPWTILEAELNPPPPAVKIVDIWPLLESKGLVDPWPLLESKGNMATADGWWLDRIGERLGLPRAYAVSEEGTAPLLVFDGGTGARLPTGRQDGWSPSGLAIGDEAVHFSGPTVERQYSAVTDQQYRELLSAQALSNRRGRSIVDVEAICNEIFPDGVWVEETGPASIKLHIISSSSDFVDVVQNNRLLPRPAGVALAVQWHDSESLGVWGLQLTATDQLWKLNLDDLSDRSGYYAAQNLPTSLSQSSAAAGYNGDLYVFDRLDDELWLINQLDADDETGRYGSLGRVYDSATGSPFPIGVVDFPSGMTTLNGDLYLLDGSTGSRRIFRFTSLREGAAAAVEVGRYNNLEGATIRTARSIAAVGGDFYVGFNSGRISKIDPADIARTTGGYGTLSVTAAGTRGTVQGMCADPEYEDALLISISEIHALWRINVNNFLDTTPPYGPIGTWAAAGVGTPIRSLALI